MILAETLQLGNPGILHFMIVTTLLFSMGLYGILTRRNAIGILLSVELMLNSAVLNFLVFNRFIVPVDDLDGLVGVDGQIMALFIIAVAAAEAVVALAIFVAFFKHRRTLDVTRATFINEQGK